jgi:hypothetical protein
MMLCPRPIGPAQLTETVNVWLTMELARVSTNSCARSGVVVFTVVMTISAPIQARCRETSGNQAS